MLLLLFRKGIDILLKSGTLLINSQSADLEENPVLNCGFFFFWGGGILVVVNYCSS